MGGLRVGVGSPCSTSDVDEGFHEALWMDPATDERDEDGWCESEDSVSVVGAEALEAPGGREVLEERVGFRDGIALITNESI